MRKKQADVGDIIKAKTSSVHFGYKRGDTLRVTSLGSYEDLVYAENLTRPFCGMRDKAILCHHEYKLVVEKGADLHRIYLLGIPIIRIEKVTKNDRE